MKSKTIITCLTFLVLIFTSAFAQDWRNSPLNSRNSDAWRNQPYTGKTTDSWRKSPLNSNDSQLRWNKNKWQKSKMYWRNSGTSWDKKNWRNRPTNWRNSPNKWNRQKWRDNPLNWRNSDLEWKNSRQKYTRGSTRQEIREWQSPKIQTLPRDTEQTQAAPKAVDTLKPRMEIVVLDDNDSKGTMRKIDSSSFAKDHSVIIYGSDGVKRIRPGQSITKRFQDGSIVIYGGYGK